jgi:hypothetical protein
MEQLKFDICLKGLDLKTQNRYQLSVLTVRLASSSTLAYVLGLDKPYLH